jgi:hypothetical protein
MSGSGPGQRYFSDTPLLRGHHGAQPDLLLRWNAIPDEASAIDVVLFLHGFSRDGAAMSLADKAAQSGLDLARRHRPTLALLPRGNWRGGNAYDFPAMLDGGLDRLVAWALAQMPGKPMPGRLILAAHSGGVMPAVAAIAGMARMPDELFLFDGLYGAAGDPFYGLATLERWLDARLAREPTRPGALRVLYIEGETGRYSRRLAGSVGERLAGADPLLARRYRVEPTPLRHREIAAFCLPLLLGAADAEFDWFGG